MTEPGIEFLQEKKLIGVQMKMSIADHKTTELWRSFMPRRKEIKNNLNTDLISMQIYGKSFDFQNFNIHIPLDKWAAIEVSDFAYLPDRMEAYTLPSGLYAVFLYKGDANDASETFRFIFERWLPQSGYEIDNRPHFEILGEKYKHDDPSSEEEIWIPIKPKE
ncbi:MAG TPA: GyrI-like domain-containing protein [Saprospiraceae bacterium]|nr:GyrI-like domain-containing protein [Saprospiraceae bacterium]